MSDIETEPDWALLLEAKRLCRQLDAVTTELAKRAAPAEESQNESA
jgi:hypothetical protein